MSAVDLPFLNPACDAARYFSVLALIRWRAMRDSTFRSNVRSTIGRRWARGPGSLPGLGSARSIPSPMSTDLCREYDSLSTSATKSA